MEIIFTLFIIAMPTYYIFKNNLTAITGTLMFMFIFFRLFFHRQ